MNHFSDQLNRIAGAAQVRISEPMRLHTTFRAGGPADYFVQPQTDEALLSLIALCKAQQMPYYIIGNGSNLLVSDEGYRGVIIQLCQNRSNIRADGSKIIAQAGALLSSVAAFALRNVLTGFEFAAGIPGTIGGACVMNAGAYGGEMKDVLVSVRLLDTQGHISDVPADALSLGYRTSRIAGSGEIVLEAAIALQTGDQTHIQARMQQLAAKRREKQPLEYGSAGSTFKRPEGYFAGKLIEDAGLRGYCIGDAAVSDKHCGFVVNKGAATASDIMRVIMHTQQEVLKQFGVTLEPEVKLLGHFDC